MKKVFFTAVITAFIVLTAVFYWLYNIAPAYKFSVLMTGNVLMATLTIITSIIVTNQVNSRPNAFVRGVYGGTFLKLFVCLIAVVIYAVTTKPHVHKPTLFILFGIYAVYTAIETWHLSKISKGTNKTD